MGSGVRSRGGGEDASDCFSDGELMILVPDAAWRTQMLSLTGEYLRQLREITDGRIERLRFVLASEVEKQ